MEMEVVRHDEGARQWSRARDILDDMRKKRESLQTSTPRGGLLLLPPPSSPISAKLTTLNQYNAVESDRAREILDTMKQRREQFSKVLVGVSSPAYSKQSLNTESTAALSWVSSSSGSDEGIIEIYSEEGESNSYVDYCYYSDEGSTTSGWSSSSSGSSTDIFSDDSSFETASLLSLWSYQPSVLYDLKEPSVPNPFTPLTKNVVSDRLEDPLERKNIRTSSARSWYREGVDDLAAQEGLLKRNQQNYRYLRREGSATSRLRADMAVIGARRAMLTSMLASISDMKDKEVDMASTILAPRPVSNASVQGPPGPVPPKPNTPRSPLPPAPPFALSSKVHLSPVLETDTAKKFFGCWSHKDGQPEDHVKTSGWPLSDLDRAPNAGRQSSDWDYVSKTLTADSPGDSMFFSDSKRDDESEVPDDSSLPFEIQFKVKKTKPRYQQGYYSRPPRAPEPAKQQQRLPLHDSNGGGIHRIAQLTEQATPPQEVKTRSPRSLERDYMIPYNVEERFCGGLYHIATLTRPPSKLSVI